MPAFSTAELTPAQTRLYRRGVAEGASRSTSVRVLTLDHDVVSEWDDRLIAGTTVGTRVPFRDAPHLTSQVFTGTFTNPRGRVVWGPQVASRHALWPNQMLQVTDSWQIGGLGEVREKVFTGVIRGFTHTGGQFQVVARGKEWLAQRELGENRRWAEGTDVARVLRELMEAVGETRFDIADVKAVLHEDLVVDAQANVWRVVQRLARARELQVFYPGNGRFTVRRLPGNVSMVWSTGEGGLIDGDPSVAFDMPEEFHNVFVRAGKQPQGGRRRPRGRWQPGPAHDLSPEAFTRGGVPGRFVDRRRNPKWGTDAECDRHAKRSGQDAMRMVYDAQFEAFVIGGWLLGDMHAAEEDTYGRQRFRVGAYSWPHGSAGPTLSVNRIRRG